MPAVIGPLQILNMGGGVMQFGDTLFTSPKTSTKISSGSGALTTGGFVLNYNLFSINNTINYSVFDQPTIGNN
ncbi:spore germination protein [Bacillus sp. FJAT-49736]|uniref:spore germination protein n=1 Tax=Bacillus sp. FJAT-49736 TaxID=2833582 RepID=UPI001BCA3C96|nr:spore germination protein [Bacillus sp. FJAT-49736]MBS4172008.1 spore germination protein [Bacillus sp. FJAT-49736]